MVTYIVVTGPTEIHLCKSQDMLFGSNTEVVLNQVHYASLDQDSRPFSL